MRPFFRRTPEQSVPAQVERGPQDLQEEGQETCGPSFCMDEGASFLELSRPEEVLLETVEEVADQWGAAVETAKTHVRNVSDATQEWADRVMANGSNRAAQRDANRAQNRPNWNANTLARIRHRSLVHINTAATQVNKNSLSLEQALASGDVEVLQTQLSELDRHLLAAPGSACNKVDVDGQFFTHPFQELFLKEYIARTHLALGVAQQPDLFRGYLSPGSIELLPPAMQRLAAADIQRGASESVILRLHQQPATTELAQGRYLANRRAYLLEHSIDSRSKIALTALTVGACAMGAARCPANEFGLCAQVFEKISPQDLPSEITEDMNRKSQSAAAATAKSLQAFAARPEQQISRWWRSSERIPYDANPSSPKQTAGKRKPKGALPTAQNLNAGLAEAPQPEVTRQKRVVVGWREAEQPAVIDMDSQTDRDKIVDGILGSKSFTEYLRTYASEKNLADVLKEAVSTILYSPNYRDVPSIVRMSYRQPYIDAQGNALTVWRLSGARMVGAGEVGRHTRIYFGMRGDKESRQVHIIRVGHKSALVKQVNRDEAF